MSFNMESFNIKKNSQGHVLVYPKNDTRWTEQNLFLRSSIWLNHDSIGDLNCLISAGFPKFFNWDEKQNPTADEIKYIYEKIDGSLLIVSKHNGNFILRTRQMFDAVGFDTKREEKGELDFFKEKILPCIDSYMGGQDTWNRSWLFEWQTDSHQIIVKVDNFKFTLVGAINHLDYSVVDQLELDHISELCNINRPKKYEIVKSNGELDLNFYVNRVDIEGFVLYTHDGEMIKLKTDWYIKKHVIKFNMKGNPYKSLIEFISDKKINMEFEDVFNCLVYEFDFEVANFYKNFIVDLLNLHNKINDAAKNLECIMITNESRVEKIKFIKSKYGDKSIELKLFIELTKGNQIDYNYFYRSICLGRKL